MHNYNTNILERVNTNDLIFKSTPNITDNGFYNNFEFIIKNSNTHSKNQKLTKKEMINIFLDCFKLIQIYH